MSTISLIVGGYVAGSNAATTDGTTGAKSDTYALSKPAIGVHINAAGTITLKDPEGNLATFTVASGSSLAYRVSQVMSTNTSLTNAEFILLYGPGSK